MSRENCINMDSCSFCYIEEVFVFTNRIRDLLLHTCLGLLLQQYIFTVWYIKYARRTVWFIPLAIIIKSKVIMIIIKLVALKTN